MRCDNCRAYVNPFCKFIEHGSRYKCNICNKNEPTPNYYYSKIDEQGIREDYYNKPELCSGSFDIKAGAE